MMAAFRMLVAVSVLAGLIATVRAQEVVTPGDGVTLPTLVRSVKAEYTPEAMDARIEGSVLLAMVVMADGNVGEVTVEKSLDSKLGLDQEAVKAAKEWTFKPRTKDGKAVAVRVHVDITFTLK